MTALNRAADAWRRLAAEQRLAGIAAAMLFLTLFLPWYTVTNRSFQKASLYGIESTDFVLGSILLVAAGVLALLFFRGEDRGFHLPGGDGTVVLAAGAWCAFLVFCRVVSPIDPDDSVAVGISWGVFVSFLAAALLAYAGFRMRAAHRPEPPLPTTVAQPAAPARPRARGRTRPGPDDEAIPGQMTFDDRED